MRYLHTRLRPDGARVKVLLDDLPEPPEPVGDQVKIQTVYSGLANAPERDLLLGLAGAGTTGPPDADIGFQSVGRVVRTGPDASSLQVGDFVFHTAGHVEFAVVPETALLVRLRPEVDRRHAALYGLAASAMHVCLDARPEFGERVLVVGAGAVGQMAAQICRLSAAEVTLCDRMPHWMEVAREACSDVRLVDLSESQWEQAVPNEGFDTVIDCTCPEIAEDLLLGALRRGGRLMLAGTRHTVSYPFDLARAREAKVLHSGGFTQDDLDLTNRLACEGRLKIGPLIQDAVPVAEAAGIYEMLRVEPDKVLGAVFVW